MRMKNPADQALKRGMLFIDETIRCYSKNPEIQFHWAKNSGGFDKRYFSLESLTKRDRRLEEFLGKEIKGSAKDYNSRAK
jgi:hypothetical protein